MGYLITQIIIYLLIAAVIGFIIGWLLRGLGRNNQEAYEGVESDSSNTSGINSLSSDGSLAGQAIKEPVTRAPAISHQIVKIEGISKSIRNALRKTGVKTTIDLIDKCSTESGFQQTVETTGAVEPVVKQWVSMADLMRVPGVDGQFAELMEACDIKSIQDLASADTQTLIATMQTVNQREGRIPDSIPLPDANIVGRWIKDAKTLPEKI